MKIPLTIYVECIIVAAFFGLICSILLAVPGALPSF